MKANGQSNKVNVGIGFVTGRRHFPELLRTYAHNWLHNPELNQEKVSFHLLVAYDTAYNMVNPEVFESIHHEVLDVVDSVLFIDDSTIEREIADLADRTGLRTDRVRSVIGKGYARRRNAVVHFAVKQLMDYLIFIDDDEYPLAVFRHKGRTLWKSQNVLGTHLASLHRADLTHGHHCGYISPIPMIELENGLPREVFRRFIEAVSNEIVSWSAVSKRMKRGGIDYASPKVLSDGPYSVEEVCGLKFISGSNLGLNLTNFYRGRVIPPFYNPPGARGEDTFLSACLSDFDVVKVPCYTFHDGFMKYKRLLHGVLPAHLQPVTPESSSVVDRFCRACVGWARYKPLLLYITDKTQFKTQIERIRRNLYKSVPVLSEALGRDFSVVSHEFEHYQRLVQTHYREFQECRKTWEELCCATLGGD
ncbi:MAG: hypothetical protein HPY55_10920 [Firmicutes bacterium]|nr:hypothetical protein [Bacillota bacterium]